MPSGLTSQREIDGTKMKLSKGVVLLFLALIFKVAVAENYTKVYMLELEIENSTYPNVTEILTDAQKDVTNARVTNINISTDCILNEMQKNCSCMPGYTWSEDMCKNHSCCNGNACALQTEETAVCLSDKRVSINATTTMEDYDYNTLFKDNSNVPDNNLTQKITHELVEQFSKLSYFYSLTVNSYSRGSLIVNYTVQLLGPVALNELVILTKSLNNSQLVTTGIVLIKVPENQPIDLGSTANINCTSPENLGNVTWFLTGDNNKTTPITKGTEATLSNTGLTDIVTLKTISGSWKGTFTCVYTQGSIEHRASNKLDIALLPEIQARSDPQFPDCRTVKIQMCMITCQISKSTENYTVQLTRDGNINLPGQTAEIQGNVISYKAELTIDCQKAGETVSVSCTFTNNRSKIKNNKTENVEIPIIRSTSTVCAADDVWPMTKSNYTASLRCDTTTVGLKTRYCTGTMWQKEISSCVNLDLNDIQNDVQVLSKGIGFIKDNAIEIFRRLRNSTSTETFNTFANINISVNILEEMHNVSQGQSNQWNDAVMPDFISSASNVLNKTEAWKNPKDDNTNLSVTYLKTIERMVNYSNLSSNFKGSKYDNVELKLCNDTCKTFNASAKADNGVVVVGFRNLHDIFPQLMQQNASSNTTILSVTTVNNTNVTRVELTFEYSEDRLPNHEMYCVFWDENKTDWSEEGCTWGGAGKAKLCTCEHNSAFTILMAKNAEELPYMDLLTYIGVGISIVSLVLCLIIEILIWDTVVKSDISNFRHVAVFNIALCLLLAHCGFLASSKPENIPPNWCHILTIVKHFFFLAVFFWMLCLSFVILHQIIFVFDHLRKKVFWGLSITLGYVCPVLCVAITFITFENGKEGQYYSKKTCWLIYKGALKGSIFAFVLPVGTIVFINLFTLAVVIMKIITPTVSEAKARDEKDVAKSMIKTIVFLSPVLGITWIFGFFIMDLDLTIKPWAQIVNYTFTVLNSLQGFFILLTNCVGEKKVRDALMKRFKGSKHSAIHSKSESSTKATSSVIKK